MFYSHEATFQTNGTKYKWLLSLFRAAAVRWSLITHRDEVPPISVSLGFIDFIVVPTFTVLTDMMERIVTPLIEEASHSGLAGFRRSR